jgi:hypothetical protein
MNPSDLLPWLGITLVVIFTLIWAFHFLFIIPHLERERPNHEYWGWLVSWLLWSELEEYFEICRSKGQNPVWGRVIYSLLGLAALIVITSLIILNM